MPGQIEPMQGQVEPIIGKLGKTQKTETLKFYEFFDVQFNLR